MSSMITATTWVPRGYAAPFPNKFVLDEGEANRIYELAKLQLEDAKDDLKEVKEHGEENSDAETHDEPNGNAKTSNGNQSKQEDDDDLREYDLDHYDDDEDADTVKSNQIDGASMGMFGNPRSLAYHESNDQDPYITLADNEDQDDEREELHILATDNLVLAAKLEDEVAHLEVYVYEDDEDNLYVHHDIMLPAIPLAVEWLDHPVGKTAAEDSSHRNFVAVGTMEPDIEIWDLDTVDSIYPNAILGDASQESSKPKKKKRSKRVNDDFHVDAVLSLAANRQHHHLLASASADKTVKLWDLPNAKCAKSYTHHDGKVCSVAWNPKESTILLSGSYDKTAVAADMRAPNGIAPRWQVESDVETVKWNPHDPNFFYVTTESGIVHYFDARSAPSKLSDSKAVWKLQAHDESVTSFDANPVIPGFLVTGSTDKKVKLWSIESSGPTLVASRDLDIGKVFSTTFGPDPEVGFRLSVAGSRGALQVWDTSTNGPVRRAFADKVAPVQGEVKERMVRVEADDEESDDDEDAPMGAQQDGWESMEE